MNVEPRGLFHLERDPTTRENLLAEHPEIAKRLLDSMRARIAREEQLSLRPETRPADAEMLERLQSLGYVTE